MTLRELVSVVVLPGDGIGPEVVEAAVSVLSATGAPLRWERHQVGAAALAATGHALPDEVVDAVARCGLALKGPVATPVGAPFRSVNVALRRALDLYVQVRPVRSFDVAGSRALDVEVVRETTEDLYRGVAVAAGTPEAQQLLAWLDSRGEMLPEDTGFSLKPISASASTRAARAALDHAARTCRRRVTVVHKASVMPETDGVFLREALALAGDYPGLRVDAMAVDAAAAELVRHPERLDVLLTTNLYGDVLSDVAAAVGGGLGMAPGVNLGDGVAVFEAVHGTAPRLAGADRANPMALILSGAMLLEHAGFREQADRVRRAVSDVVVLGREVTYDLRVDGDDRPTVGTRAAAAAVVAALV